MQESAIPELGLPEDLIEEIRSLAYNQTESTHERDLPEDSRKILRVTGRTLISSNVRDNDTSKKTYSVSVLLLRGTSTSKTDTVLNRAYIIFVKDTARVPRPAYSKAKGIIYLWMHYRNLNTVLAQIQSSTAYCWIGRFKDGHIYADIHSEH
jgi:hypothetical protein